MDLAQVRTKLQGFGMQLLDGIDPNPDNFVCAGIVHMKAQQVGCLLRLEPNKQAQVIKILNVQGSFNINYNCLNQNFTFFILLAINKFCKINVTFLQMFRLTVRSSKESMSIEICDLLVDQF